MNGAGIERMRAAGISVTVGLLKDESIRLNGAFFTSHGQNRPLVILKWAQSADGYIDKCRDGGCALSVSTPVSRVAVHKLRSCCDAILVGTRTALLDDPALDVRYWAGRAPVRLVLDREGKLPRSLRLFDSSCRTIVYTACEQSLGCGKNIEQKVLDFGQDVVPQILSHLHSLKLGSLLVEGGSTLLQSFVDSSLWDIARVEVNPALVVGDGVSAPQLPAGIVPVETTCGGNLLLHYRK